MTENGGGARESGRPSRLTELINMEPMGQGPAAPGSTSGPGAAPPEPMPPEPVPLELSPEERVVIGRREFAVRLGEFRRTAVLVPFDPYGSLWTADRNGVRWICAFSDEAALARFASAQGDDRRAWTYRTVLGVRLLDVMVPMLGMPAGVALDAGSADGTLFPPVAGIVPEAAAVDLKET
ncbi:SseB family protein [Streptomyces jumonjinensis]|uniref:SseB family protein n=1 Tax=Streptomyces jumonjinensis TaxID=1945 RepID=UPI003787C9AA